MKKFRGKLVKRSSQNNLNGESHSIDWNKYDERLIECIEHGDVIRLRSTLSKKQVSPTKISPYGTTALHSACQHGNIECLDALLEMKANISVQDKSGSTILHVAAKAGHIECVQRVLDLGVDSNCQDGKRMTPLHLATAKGHVEVVQLLVGCNASLNITDKDGRTPLLMAIQSGHEEIVCLLLDKGAKVNIADNAKKTALMYASLLGLTKCVETLLKRGANSRLVDSQSHTAEDYARIGGHKEVIAIIKDAPTVATWDAGEDSEEEEEEPEIPNGELVSAFSNQDSEEVSIASHQNIVPSSQMVWIDTSSRSSGSFSSKTSTAISSPRASLSMPGRDLTLEIKELEEENEVLNQELGKLRVQHQKTLDRLRFTETELEAERKKSPSPSPLKNSRQMNGSIEEDLTEWKDHKIEELELEVSKLQVDLQNERTSRKETEEKVEKLKAQVTSYEDRQGGSYFSDSDQDDQYLPGLHDSPRGKTISKNRLSSLSVQVDNLKKENEDVRAQLKSRVNGDVNHNDSTISLSVYEQLKESSEEEIFSLTERIQGLTLANENLEKEVLESRRNIEKSNQETMAGIKSSAEQSHKKFLESEVNRLRKQIKSAEAEHERRINMYRIHLISAVQGELDADVEGALQTIISLRASEQFC